jgi:hypothetical protein
MTSIQKVAGRKGLGMAGLAFVLTACCKVPEGVIGGRWVLVSRAEPAAGPATAPRHGEPLSVVATPEVQNACFSSDSLDQHFGAQCAAHETEGGATSTMSDEVLPGTAPTPSEVRWYCDRQTLLRIVLRRCGSTNTFAVGEIAVARGAN